MSQLLRNHLDKLKAALLSLSPTGATGFEGLIGAALHEISGVPFRLASSGSQFGVDGKPAYEGDAICFEGKRYDGTVPRAEVLSKIAELSIHDTDADIWVLGSSTQISSQLADNARELGRKSGIFVLILDWSKTDLPPLSVALTMGALRVEDFLKNNINNKAMLQEALTALTAIRNSGDYEIHATRIRSECDASSVGLALAQKGNARWLIDVFSSRGRARIKLGQPLSPGEAHKYIIPRQDLIDKLNPYLMGPPDESVVCVLGDEGNGKSWAVAQSWLTVQHKPLMIVLRPEEFEGSPVKNEITDLLITTIIDQTEDEPSATTRKRWQRLLKRWRSKSAPESPRIVVLIDGINQRPDTDWARIIERIVDELHHLGGRLIITARRSFFQDRVQKRLCARHNEILAPEWSPAERDEILSRQGIKAADLHPAVALSMLNPRLLSMAVELFDKVAITHFEELTVSRLLFEHLRMSERDAATLQTARDFAVTLQSHAQEMLTRVKNKQQDDLHIFQGEVVAVADGRFFHAVNGDPTCYSLKDDGLTLALGFAVTHRLRIAQRNARNLDEALNELTEPISALDDTADVMLAALTVVAAEESLHQDLGSALVRGFSVLQNPDQAMFPAFVGLARSQPRSFMAAARTLCLRGGHQANFDWVEGALIIAGKDGGVWPKMIDAVHSWLSVYSLSPDRGMFSNLTHDPLEKVEKEQEKNRQKIKGKVDALSASETAIMNRLEEADGDLSRLSRLALFLLAGKELSPFSTSLLNWTFANALNSDRAAPYKDFFNLIRLNRIDWVQARAALLEASAKLRGEDVSPTGKWSLVNILRATGHPLDGKEMLTLVTDLTKDRPAFQGWSLINDLCNTDPCDPMSERPENISRTAEQYATIDVGKLRNHMGSSSEDHILSQARPGMVRFIPDPALAKHKELIADVLTRAGIPLRQGLLELQQHSALLTIDDALAFIKMRSEVKTNGQLDGMSEQDAWLISQYSLLLAFPLMNAREQIEILIADNGNENVLLNLMDLAKPLGEGEFEEFLKISCRTGNERQQYLLLALARYTSVPLSACSRLLVGTLFKSASSRVRAQALGIMGRNGEPELMKEVAKSTWTAAETEDDLESWYGSVALLEAASRGHIGHDEVIERISPSFYGRAALILDEDAVRSLGHKLDESIRHAIDLESNVTAPDIELQIRSANSLEPSLFKLSERSSEKMDMEEMWKRLSESREIYEQRQKRQHDAFLSFKSNLSQAKARIILDHFSFKELEAVIEANGELADKWYALFMNSAKGKLSAVHNLIIPFAQALGKKHPAKTKELFLLIEGSKPLVRYTFGRARVELTAMAIWAGQSNPILDELRFSRLDGAATDYDLAQEVLAALMNGQHELLKTYIETRMNREEPAEIARAIMVAGFSDRSEFNDKILTRYHDSAGLIGSAQKAAQYAYERNNWARHWFDMISRAETNADFWRYSVLFTKIVDGRFDVWEDKYTFQGAALKLFFPSITHEINNRINRWETHRKKKLFGDEAPAPIFLKISLD